MSGNHIVYWRGKPLDEMSREELIEAAEWLFAKYREHYTPEAIHERALGKVAELKVGAPRH